MDKETASRETASQETASRETEMERHLRKHAREPKLEADGQTLMTYRVFRGIDRTRWNEWYQREGRPEGKAASYNEAAREKKLKKKYLKEISRRYRARQGFNGRVHLSELPLPTKDQILDRLRELSKLPELSDARLGLGGDYGKESYDHFSTIVVFYQIREEPEQEAGEPEVEKEEYWERIERLDRVRQELEEEYCKPVAMIYTSFDMGVVWASAEEGEV